MNAETQILTDTLTSIGKSMDKIALELQMIRKMMEFDQRMTLRESRRTKALNKSVLTESANAAVPNKEKFTAETALEMIKSIRNGDYLH